MSTTVVRPSPPSTPMPRTIRWAVPIIAVGAVAARLPGIAHAPRPDEAGFLAIGQQWHAGGGSLYGSYWVDRPPLLITIFQLASKLGGIVPLRLLGCLAVVGMVLGIAHIARRTAGDRAAMWAALSVAVLTASPLFGGAEVNGELLSAPFVVGGVAAAVHALEAKSGRQALRAALLTGAAMACALMVKQNMADVGVFAATAGLIAARRGEITRSRLLVLAGGLAAGSALAGGVVAAWTLSHGTSLSGVFYAMYPFRVAASQVLASSTGSQASSRIWTMLIGWVASGAAVVTIVAGAAVVTRRLRGSVAGALLAVVAFDSVSVLLGGNYWRHYLIELVVPVSLLAGLLVARRQPGIRTILVGSALVSAIAWTLVLPRAGSVTQGALIGSAVQQAAVSSDTIVTLYGHAEVTEVSGLSSPYPYLWSLPAKTLDPDQELMGDVLSGPSAPTWVVVWKQVSTWGMDTTRTSTILAERYHRVADLHGHTIYLRDDVTRRTPRLSGGPSTRVAAIQHQEDLP